MNNKQEEMEETNMKMIKAIVRPENQRMYLMHCLQAVLQQQPK